MLTYTREALLVFQAVGSAPPADIPAEIRKHRRGTRAGRRVREKKDSNRRFKPCLPSVVMGNVRSLANKLDELAALVSSQRQYRECSLMCFTETWLTGNIPDSAFELAGFTLVRADREKQSGKKKGGGLAVFVNSRWCNPGHITVKELICTPDVELLVVGLRPYYIPREFSHAILVLVYIPPSAVAAHASDVIHSTVAGLQTQHPSAFITINGDFNHVSLSRTLTNFTQYVTCKTRENKTLDLFYANVKEAYRCSALPPLGRSDHNLIQLVPTYRPVFRQQPTTTRTVQVWSEEAEEALQVCFQTTDWGMFQEDYGDDIEGLSHCITDYILFCESSIVPTKRVRCFPNNKPWINKDMKALLNRKKRAFMAGDREEVKSVQKELKRELKEAKNSYKDRLESKLQHNNAREVWKGLDRITGRKQPGPAVVGNQERANELNLFFNRFDSCTPVSTIAMAGSPPTTIHTSATALPPSAPAMPMRRKQMTQQQPFTPCPNIHFNNKDNVTPLPPSSPSPFIITHSQVERQFSKLRNNKAKGPDDINPRVLKVCAGQLAGVFQHLFNLSLRLKEVPQLWKTSCIVPIPKKGRPSALNDYRPVALTSHVMKTFERLVLQHLRPLVGGSLDPLQFAYQAHIGVEDAMIYLLHRAYSHLERPGGTVRIMFFDFSSAFNTIRPPLLAEKLLEMQVDHDLVAWITDYLTGRPQYVRLQGCLSDVVMSNTGAPQGTVLSPFLFTIYTSDFRYRTNTCHLQKFSDDSSIVSCITEDKEEEYRDLIESFVGWCDNNHLQLNTGKTKELVVDFRRNRKPPTPVTIQGVEVEMVDSYRFLGVQLNNKLDWSNNTEALYRKGQSRLFFLRRLRSFNVCNRMLQMFYQSVVASALFFAVACWGGGIKAGDANRLNKLVKKASSVVGVKLDSLEVVAERRMRGKINAILENSSHPLHEELRLMRSAFSNRLILPRCRTERLRRSFVPAAIRLFNMANTKTSDPCASQL